MRWPRDPRLIEGVFELLQRAGRSGQNQWPTLAALLAQQQDPRLPAILERFDLGSRATRVELSSPVSYHRRDASGDRLHETIARAMGENPVPTSRRRRLPAAALITVYAAIDVVPGDFVNITPYVVTLLVLAFASQRLRMPAADGQVYRRGSAG